MTRRILFIRHGETDWNASGRLQGQRDIPLNAAGREQAAQAGRRLLRFASDPGALPWLVSPLQRARDTALLAREALGLPPDRFVLEPRIRELLYGEWEGLTWREAHARDPLIAARRAADKWDMAAPGGESYAMMADRLRPWLQSLAPETVLVSHGGVARVLLYLEAGLAPQAAATQDIWQGRVLLIADGRFEWN